MINSAALTQALQDLEHHGLAVSDDFFPWDFCRNILHDLEHCREHNNLRPAAIGRGQGKQVQGKIRGDSIVWLDEPGSSSAQRDFFQDLHSLRSALNESFYLGLNAVEAHYALYPPGTGYERHIDQHAQTTQRKVTFILYLNPDWQKADGGELLVYNPQSPGEVLRTIEPRFGRWVLFRSEVFPHQVATSHQERKSLTGWLRREGI